MTALFAGLHGVVVGSSLLLFPLATQDVVSSSSSSSSFNTIIVAILLCHITLHAGRAITAFFNALSLSSSVVMSLFLTVVVLVLFSFSSSLAWLLLLRLVFGMLSGYLRYFFDFNRGSFQSRNAWILSTGAASFLSCVFYSGNNSLLSSFHPSHSFFSAHPLFMSFSVLAVSIVVTFVVFVFSEKYGFIDEEDEYRGLISNERNKKTSIFSKTRIEEDLMEEGFCDLGSQGPSHRKERSNSSSEDDLNFIDLQVPGRYLRGCGGDRTEALRRWRLTLDWRREHGVDGILSEPQPHFFTIKKHYPHFIHGRSFPGNHVVYYEQLGKIDLEALRKQGVSVSQLLRHYIFMAEYLWTYVETDYEHGKSITVLDVNGVGVSDLVGDPLDFLKESTKLIQNHYVERSQKIFVVNASYMFSWLWRMVQPMINENTRRKISILSDDLSELVAYVGAASLPEEYGGESGAKLGTSEEEQRLAIFVNKLNNNSSSSQDETHDSSHSSDSQQTSYGSVAKVSPAFTGSSHSSSRSRRRKASRSPKTAHLGYRNIRIKGGDTSSDDFDEFELGYSSSGSDGDASEGDLDCADKSSSDNEEEAPPGTSQLSRMSGMMAQFYDKSVQTLRRVVYRSDSEPRAAFLGGENKFSFDNGKWVEDKAHKKRQKQQRSDLLRGNAAKSAHSCVENEQDETVVRAIQASQGYFSESESEGETMSLRRRIRSFRQHISSKKQEALRRVSWWNVLHWCWRAALVASLDVILALTLLDQKNNGLGLPPLFLGSFFLVGTLLVWVYQTKCINSIHKPVAGFLYKCLSSAFAAEVISVICFGVLYALYGANSSGFHSMLVISSLGVTFLAFMHSLGVTTLFTSSVMISHRSPLHSPFSRSKSHLADAAGSLIGLSFALILNAMHWNPLSIMMFVMAFTVSVHTIVAVFNCAHPHAAGRGVTMGTILW